MKMENSLWASLRPSAPGAESRVTESPRREQGWTEQAEVRLQGSTQEWSLGQLSGGPDHHPGRPGCFSQHTTPHWEWEAARNQLCGLE